MWLARQHMCLCSRLLTALPSRHPFPADNSVFDVPQIGIAKVCVGRAGRWPNHAHARSGIIAAAAIAVPLLPSPTLFPTPPQPTLPQIDMEGRHVSLYRPGHEHFLLEPKFVPRPGATAEDDGWLLSVGFHSGERRGAGAVPLLCCSPRCHRRCDWVWRWVWWLCMAWHVASLSWVASHAAALCAHKWPPQAPRSRSWSSWTPSSWSGGRWPRCASGG